MFNSVLIYELAVLKQFAEPLLFQIDKGRTGILRGQETSEVPGIFPGCDQ